MRVCVRARKIMTLLKSSTAKRSTRANTTRSCRRIERPFQNLRNMRHREEVAAGDPTVGANCALMTVLRCTGRRYGFGLSCGPGRDDSGSRGVALAHGHPLSPSEGIQCGSGAPAHV